MSLPPYSLWFAHLASFARIILPSNICMYPRTMGSSIPFPLWETGPTRECTNMEIIFELDVCVTCIIFYIDINNQQDTTTFSFINRFKLDRNMLGLFKKINKPKSCCILLVVYIDVNYCYQRSLLHVSATYCGHLEGGIVWRIYYIERQNNLIYKYKVLSFK